MLEDIYKEIKVPTIGIYKEKGSKFIAYSYPIYSEHDIKEKLDEVKKIEYAARHYCYAYILNPDKSEQRSNDDGEPWTCAYCEMEKESNEKQHLFQNGLVCPDCFDSAMGFD